MYGIDSQTIEYLATQMSDSQLSTAILCRDRSS